MELFLIRKLKPYQNLFESTFITDWLMHKVSYFQNFPYDFHISLIIASNTIILLLDINIYELDCSEKLSVENPRMELTLHEMSVRAQTLKDDWYPWLDVVHITLTILTIRKEAGMEFSRNHPFATWLASIVASFAGSVIANPLLGLYKYIVLKDKKHFETVK